MLICAGPLLLRRRIPKILPRCSLKLLHHGYGTSPLRRHADVFPAQVQDPPSDAILPSLKTIPQAAQTMTEKLVQRSSLDLKEGQFVRSGDYVILRPHKAMTHDNSWPVALKFFSIGAEKVYDPTQLVMTLDHDVQNQSEKNLMKYKQIEDFARKHNIDFYGAGRGIGHQIMCEEGYAFPGTLSVASDSHANMYGGLGCLGTAVVRSDAASIWATGKTWWQVPSIAKVTFTGVLPPGVTGKDVIVALSGLFNKDQVLNHAIEFVGSEKTMRSLSVDARLTIANMTTEWGALSGLFPIDSVLEGWLRGRATVAAMSQATDLTGVFAPQRFSHQRIDDLFANPISADKGATYAKHLFLNLSSLCEFVSGPNSVKVATALSELEKQHIRIDKAYLVSCTNSRASDLAAAAQVFKKAKEKGEVATIPNSVKFYVAAASKPEQEAAEAAGDWQILLDAGAEALPSGCGPCIGLARHRLYPFEIEEDADSIISQGTGLLEPNEVGISASNRNFKGRMGSPAAKAYLASPEVVAASALSGKIASPGHYQKPTNWSGVVLGEGDGIREEDRMITAEEALEKIICQLDNVIDTAEKEIMPEQTTPAKEIEILPGFPEKIEGEIVFCDADNINTDGIYPGKYTYQDDVSSDKMAEVCMENYDAAFSSIAQAGDILVSGFNFGCGSSREQAATAILAKKIPLVVAGSFGNIFSRNSINNALMNLEVPDLIQRLRETFSEKQSLQKSQQNVAEPSQNRESLDSPPPAPPVTPSSEKLLTRRTGWKFSWNVRFSTVSVRESDTGSTWTQTVGALPPNVQEIFACRGLENWVKKEIAANS